MKILITGATGFVGRALVSLLRTTEHDLCLVSRNSSYTNHPEKVIAIGDIDASTDWSGYLKEIDVVIHLAARVHVMNEDSDNPLEAFRQVNVDGTLNLANQAANADVKRFIFVSSVKVNGESTAIDKPFKFSDDAHPQDAYGISKLEAEEGLVKVSHSTGMEVVVIRPPLIYGEGVKANFANMLKLVKFGLPLPFGVIKNKRSLIYVENLTSFIAACITNKNAANKTFLVSDGEDVSTTKLLKACAVALNKKIWLVPIPQSWLFFCFKLLGKQSLAQRLLGNLQVDSQYACETLNWKPPYTLAQGLEKTVNHKNNKIKA
jgi:nucleoside-diphosphate-sugar epimerase